MPDDVESVEQHEDEIVAFWRYEQLERMGFKHEEICTLQMAGVDLHDAEKLIIASCEPELVVKILT